MAPIGLAIGLFTTPASPAEVVKDGAEFSLDFAEQNLCFIHPIELRRSEICEGLTLDDVTLPTETDMQPLASALKTLPNGDLLAVTVIRIRGYETPPTPGTLTRKLDGLAGGIAKGLPKGAQIREKKAVIARWGGADGLQATIDVSGGESPLVQSLGHSKMFLVGSETAAYHVTVSGPRSSAAEVDALFEAIARTMVVAHPARPADGDTLGYRLGRLFVWVLMLIGVGIAALMSRRRAKKSGRE